MLHCFCLAFSGCEQDTPQQALCTDELVEILLFLDQLVHPHTMPVVVLLLRSVTMPWDGQNVPSTKPVLVYNNMSGKTPFGFHGELGN